MKYSKLALTNAFNHRDRYLGKNSYSYNPKINIILNQIMFGKTNVFYTFLQRAVTYIVMMPHMGIYDKPLLLWLECVDNLLLYQHNFYIGIDINNDNTIGMSAHVILKSMEFFNILTNDCYELL